jgi:hypothetical protein
MMKSFAASPVALLELPAGSTVLSSEELDSTLGGSPDPVSIAILVFAASVVIGVIDRILFGGCRCR